MPDTKFTHNELMTIYGTIKHNRDIANDMLDKMSENDPDRSAFVETNKVYNSILRKLKNIFDENDINFKGL